MRLSSLLMSVFALIGVVLALLGGMVTYQSVSELRDIRRAAVLSDIDATAMSATVAMSLERSVVQVALAFADPIPSEFRAIVDEQRATADAGLNTALQKVGAATFLSTGDDYVQQTRASLARVAELRAEIDALLARPIAERDAGRAYELPFELKAEVVRLKNATDLLRNRIGVSTQLAGALQVAQVRSWEVREFGGRARTYFAIATLNGEAISTAARGLLSIDNERAREAWMSRKHGIQSVSGLSQEIQDEIASAEALYFGEYTPLIDRLEAISTSTAPGRTPDYPIAFPDFFAFSNEALGAMETLSQNSGAALKAYWTGRERAAYWTTVTSCALALLSLAGLVAIFTVIRVRVVGLLAAATRILTSLAAGDLDIQIRRNLKELHEIKELYGTVESFRDALQDGKRLEVEAKQAEALRIEAEQRETENERTRMEQRAAAAEEEKAEVQARQERESLAAAEIARVVEACAAGDFSHRLNTDDKEGVSAKSAMA